MGKKSILVSATDTFHEIVLIYLSSIAAATVLFSAFEHKAIWDSFWWACVTAMTVGYGDMYPVTVGGRLVAIVLMNFVPLAVVPMFVARFLGKIVEDRNAFTHEEQEQIKADLVSIKGKLGIG